MNHFRDILQNQGVDEDLIEPEWTMLKADLYARYSSNSFH